MKKNQYIDFIYQSSNRMQDLVKGLMDYSESEKVKELATIDCSIARFSLICQ
jgi:hypothetical protein